MVKQIIAGEDKAIAAANDRLLIRDTTANVDKDTSVAGLAPAISVNLPDGTNVIAYKEGLTTGQATASATYVDATGMTLTFTTDAATTSIVLHAEIPVSGDTSGTVANFAITDNSNNILITRSYTQYTGSTALVNTVPVTKRLTVTANTTYTFKLRWSTGGSGTFVINNGDIATRPTLLWAVKS